MKKTEFALILLTLFALTLKLFQLTGASTLTVLSLFALSIYYQFFSFALFNNISFRGIFKKSSYINTKRIIAAIGVGCILASLIIGILFKLQYWTGANYLLTTGLISNGIISFFAAFFYFRKKDEYYKMALTRTVIFECLGTICLFIL